MPRGKNKLEKNQGFTTVELLTVIAILGFLGLAFYSLFSFSLLGHNKAMNIADEQNDLNIIQTHFYNELANAVDLQLLDKLPDPLDNNFNYIYLDNGSLVLKDSSRTLTIAKDRIDSIMFTLEEASPAGNNLYKYILVYTINGKEYSLLLNNIQHEIAANNKAIIAYKKP